MRLVVWFKQRKMRARRDMKKVEFRLQVDGKSVPIARYVGGA